ncbi:hypothetical protein BJY01DRAFT_250544 [Aspergillus pseudoustus]|uniref:MYND-type domain-containing protein n=1 Tax=Aspergillus pseudoustus TaxID=1810923 RepID=A0ABR4JH44_9EURO
MSHQHFGGGLTFRSFAQLPRQLRAGHPLDPNEQYREWTFAAQIVAITASNHYDAALVVRDGDEQVLTVGFTLDRENEAQRLPRSTLKTGCSILLLNVRKCPIRGGSNVMGIEVKDIGHMKVLPFSFTTVVSLYKRVSNSNVVEDGKRICYGCLDKRRGLHPCPLCGLVFFCGRECQVISVVEGSHAHDCKILRDPDLAVLLRGEFLERFSSVRLVTV